MVRYGLALAGVAIAVLFAGVLAIIIFGDIWTKVGLGAAFLVVGGGLLGLAWYTDRKDKAKRREIDELPRI
jgi:Flp pilus assembly protein TadB